MVIFSGHCAELWQIAAAEPCSHRVAIAPTLPAASSRTDSIEQALRIFAVGHKPRSRRVNPDDLPIRRFAGAPVRPEAA
jgi:hypothetical protein